MQTKILRIEQKDANTAEIEQKLNQEIKSLEEQGRKIRDIRHAVGRDAGANSGIENKFCITIIIMYEA